MRTSYHRQDESGVGECSEETEKNHQLEDEKLSHEEARLELDEVHVEHGLA
jgi:hypothetical protein